MVYLRHAQASISTKKEKTGAHTRIPRAHEIARRQKGFEAPPQSRQTATHHLIMLPLVPHLIHIDGPSRVTIVVSKKIEARASHRNRMRRLIRESLRHLVPVGTGGTIIVRKNIAEYKQTEVEEMVKNIVHEARRS